MGLSVKVTPGYTFQEGEEITADKVNALANPTLDVEGGVDPSTIADGSVTTAKLATGAFSADATGQGKMADTFVTTAKLADGAVSADVPGASKLPDGAVATGKLADGVLSADATGRAKMAANFLLPIHFAADAGAMSSSGAVSVDWSKGSVFRFALTGSVTLTQANMTDGQLIELVFVFPVFMAYAVNYADTIIWKGGTAPSSGLSGPAVGMVWLLRLNSKFYGWFKWPF